VTDVRYKTKVTAVGPEVPQLLIGGRLILFGPQAPAELHEICALHTPAGPMQAIKPGDELQIGASMLTVTAVGDVANDNLQSLGHVSLRRGGEPDPLPGEILVDGSFPMIITPGLEIEFRGAA
jgi:PTS system glucitol/sorbitol-specific IIA component